MCTKIYYIGLLTMIYSVFFVSDLYAQGNVVCDLDGVVEEGERCDDGNAFNCDSCTNDCQPGPQLDFVLMVEGSFSMGNARNRSARPVHDVDIDSFWISRREITNQDYSFCVDAGACTVPRSSRGCTYGQEGGENLPVNCVSWDQANSFANWCGTELKLPTEAQWEYAARDHGTQIDYPMNTSPSCDNSNLRGCGNATSDVCSHGVHAIHGGRMAQTQNELCDMAGNVREWVYDTYTSYRNFDHEQGTAYHVTGRRGRNKVIRGGSYLSRDNQAKTTYRNRGKSNRFAKDLGFRVACIEGDCPITPLAICGNGVVEEMEECDDGDDNDVNECKNDCTQPFCGNGEVEMGEDCDDGDLDNNNECPNNCILISEEYTSEFFQNEPSGGQQCTDWIAFRDSIRADKAYTEIQLFGSLDQVGRSCSGEEANIICQALREGTNVSIPCDGRTWRTGQCGRGLELSTDGSRCSCNNSYTVRPCIGNSNWGGIGLTCGANDQTLNVVCR